MLSLLFVGCTKLDINVLFDVFTPEFAASSAWKCLLVAFFRSHLSIAQYLG